MVKSIHSKPLRLYSTTRLLYWSARPSGKGSGLNKDSTRGTIREVIPNPARLVSSLTLFCRRISCWSSSKRNMKLKCRHFITFKHANDRFSHSQFIIIAQNRHCILPILYAICTASPEKSKVWSFLDCGLW